VDRPAPARTLVRALVAIAACMGTGPHAADVAVDALDNAGAVLIHVTERDLNRIVRGSFHARGAGRIAGARAEAGHGMTDVTWRARISEPVVTLHDDGRLDVDLAIEEAAFDIGRVERKFLARRARCEHVGAEVEPGHPLDVSLGVELRVLAGDLEVVPRELTLTDPRDLRLRQPERCDNLPLPKWLLWRLGKPALRRGLDRLDDVLLESLRRGADELGSDNGLLRKEWHLTSALDGRRSSGLVLYPHAVSTSGKSLLVVLGTTSGAGRESAADPVPVPDWAGDLADRTYVALSHDLVNGVLDFLFAGAERSPLASGARVRSMLGAGGIPVLAPGLRHEPPESLAFSLRFGAPPRVDFTEVAGEDGPRAAIRLALDGVELGVERAGEGRVGAIEIVRARVTVVPYLNPLGGISFEVAENDWDVRGRDLAIDEALFAGLLQELTFGKAFETTYAPIARELFGFGGTDLAPRWFRLAEPYLVVEIGNASDVRAEADRAAPGTARAD
jgi:hypothetical protein